VNNILSAYIYDLGRVLQNELLGSLFENRLEARKPLNPEMFPLTLNPALYEARKLYFRNNTAWGKNCQSAEENVLQEIGAIGARPYKPPSE
jgi:hypothetical protein